MQNILEGERAEQNPDAGRLQDCAMGLTVQFQAIRTTSMTVHTLRHMVPSHRTQMQTEPNMKPEDKEVGVQVSATTDALWKGT